MTCRVRVLLPRPSRYRLGFTPRTLQTYQRVRTARVLRSRHTLSSVEVDLGTVAGLSDMTSGPPVRMDPESVSATAPIYLNGTPPSAPAPGDRGGTPLHEERSEVPRDTGGVECGAPGWVQPHRVGAGGRVA